MIFPWLPFMVDIVSPIAVVFIVVHLSDVRSSYERLIRSEALVLYSSICKKKKKFTQIYPVEIRIKILARLADIKFIVSLNHNSLEFLH